MKAQWRVILEGSIEEALLAVDLYNQPRQPRRLEAFLVHMHIAWLYLLHAELQRAGVDYRYRLPNGRFERIDGEPKTWDLQKCVAYRWPGGGAVRKNLELTIGLRNKVEHRYHEIIAKMTAGYAQALLLNYEEELTTQFGQSFSLGEQLRCPIFVGSIAPLSQAQIKAMNSSMPRSARDYIASFESGLSAEITTDMHYEFRITLIPKLGAKGEADTSMTFVRESELTETEKKTLEDLGKSGRVVVREQTRPVSGAGMFRPAEAAAKLQERVPFVIGVHHVVRAWKNSDCRPPNGSTHPERTDERYCVYDEPHRDYLYTEAFVNKVAREIQTAEKFTVFMGLAPALLDAS